MKHLLYMVISLLLLPSCNKDDSALAEAGLPANMDGNIRMIVGDITFKVRLNDNATAAAFKAMLPLTLNMNDFNNNEKVCSLPNSLPASASNPGTIRTGNIMLYGSSSLVLFYETFSTPYSYTTIGQVDNISELKTTLGKGNVSIKFEPE